MTKSEPKMMDFLLDVEERLSGFKRKLNGSTFLDTIPLIPGQAIYVFNWNEDLVSY